MKKLIYITTFISLILSFSACENDLNNRILPEDEQLMNTERSAFYAMIGILQLVQQAGDNAVLLGELRGDLMDVTQNSSQDMRDIVEFKADSANEYIQPQKFYAIINNCNLLINKIDTSLIISGTKVLQKEMKVAKTFRAWAYMQLMQQYGKVYYYAEPMLSVSDRNNYLVIDNMTQLTDSLIPDLLPFCPTDGLAESYPDYKSIGSFASQNLFIPTRFMLGEMYLWRNEYTLAANIYYQLIYTEKLVVLNFNNTWNSTQTGYITQWPNLFSNLAVKEQLAYIGYTSEYANNTTLSTLASATVYKIAPSAVAVNNWESQTYSITNAQTLSGDLRGRNGSYANFSKLNELNDREDFVRINKYSYMTDYTTLCRTSLVYLRYAEALNRMGKPTMAFVFLKYGLNKDKLELYAPKELKTAEAFIDFGQVSSAKNTIFASNYGMRARGCGGVDLNNSFRIPADITDSIAWVEDQLVTELALETAFEGNRFNDLMRISEHRADPTYLAAKVSAKFSDTRKNVIFNRLSTKSKWYLPSEE